MQEFSTDNLALAPYLQMNGLKYVRAEPAIGKNDKPVVMFVFEDSKGIGKDLELDFARSDVKQYRDLLFFFRNEIDKLKRQLYKVRLEESRKNDDKYIDDNDDVKEG